MIESRLQELRDWIQNLAEKLEAEESPSVENYVSFLKEPVLLQQLVDIIAALPEELEDTPNFYQSACILAFDICVAQLQAAIEHQNKHAPKLLTQLMDYLANTVQTSTHTLGFWLPILNAFYESQVDLNDSLQSAFLEVAGREDLQPLEEQDYIQSIREILADLSDLSDFDIAEHFFSQSHAMPPEFYMDLLLDLYSTEEGKEIGVLFLLHPKAEVRQIVLATLDHIMPRLKLSELSLTRLSIIQNWYPSQFEFYFHRWIKIQRRQGVSFLPPNVSGVGKIMATEVDGAGSQGIIIHIEQKIGHQVCGILYKQTIGIKDVWMTTLLSKAEVRQYYHEIFDDRVSLRKVDFNYLKMMTNHFLAMLQEKGELPPLHLLEIQMLLGLTFRPERIDLEMIQQELGVQIVPFTADVVEDGIKHTKRWFSEKIYTQSWFEEDAEIDTYVNQCCSFVDGVKVCSFDKAQNLILSAIFEARRDKWAFHFLWTALWAKAQAAKKERFWKDAFLVAYAIYSGRPLEEIPVMRDICYLTVMNSLETMQDRRSHLNISSN